MIFKSPGGSISVFLIVLMYALWSIVFPLGKVAIQYSSPAFLTGFRMVLAAAIILLYSFFTNRFYLKLRLKQWGQVFLIALFSVYLTNILEFWGLEYLSASKACFIYGLSPFFAVLFSYLHFNEKMSFKKWIGLTIGFIGFVPVLMGQTGEEGLLNAFGFISWPALAVVVSAFCSVYGWVLFRMIVKDNDVSSIMVNGVAMLIGGIMALLHSFLMENWDPTPVAQTHLRPFLESALLITVISSLICYNLYGFMLKRFTATFLSFFGLLSPIFASFNSWFLLNEALALSIFLSSGILSLGLWMIYREEIKQGYISSKI